MERPFLYWEGAQESVISEHAFMFFLYRDDVMKWKFFPRYWPFMRGIRRSPIPLTKASESGLWRFLWSAHERTAE